MFDIEDRKIYTKSKVAKISEALTSIFNSGNTAGWFATLVLHYVPHLITVLLFLYYPFNLNFLMIWVLGMFLHLFFNGCIHLRLERSLFNNKKWYGPYHILENFGIELNTKTITKYLYILITVIAAIYVIKLIQYWFDTPDNSTPANIFFIKNKLLWALILGWVLQFTAFLII